MAPLPPPPTIVLYGKPGCGLCDEAHDIVAAILDQRAAAGFARPTLDERDITTNDDWLASYAFDIPVLAVGQRELRLATSAAAIRRFLEDAGT